MASMSGEEFGQEPESARAKFEVVQSLAKLEEYLEAMEATYETSLIFFEGSSDHAQSFYKRLIRIHLDRMASRLAEPWSKENTIRKIRKLVREGD